MYCSNCTFLAPASLPLATSDMRWRASSSLPLASISSHLVLRNAHASELPFSTSVACASSSATASLASVASATAVSTAPMSGRSSPSSSAVSSANLLRQ